MLKMIYRWCKAYKNSIDGLLWAYTNEKAFKEDVFVALILGIIAVFIAPDKLSMSVMFITIFLLLIAELLNTGIEKSIDRFSLERHPLSKIAKDVSSAAVILTLINIVVVWAIILVDF